MDKTAKSFPKWLRDDLSVKKLPAIYYGVLAQVQIQPSIVTETQSNIFKLSHKNFMDRYTDTERVHHLLVASQLPNDVMGHIWAYCNRSFPGKLTNRELCLALSLVAIFQETLSNNNDNNTVETNDKKIKTTHVEKKKDPFEIVKNISKPPVPKLYSVPSGRNSNGKKETNSIEPSLLINIDECQQQQQQSQSLGLEVQKDIVLTFKTISSSDIDDTVDILNQKLAKACKVWTTMLEALLRVFKRTFDILNVENSRSGAIEALKSARGKEFAANLSFCYPLAYNINIKCKILFKRFEFRLSAESKLYVTTMNDLMTSLNEYWAVIMNLYHESGSTFVVEFVMDELVQDESVILKSETFNDLTKELFDDSRRNFCFICHCRYFLANSSKFDHKLADLIDDSLATQDSRHYYHVKCANFWLHQVDSKLPYRRDEILSPLKSK